MFCFFSPSTKMEKTRKIKRSVWDMLSLICLLDIYIEILSRQSDTYVWNSKAIVEWSHKFWSINMQMISEVLVPDVATQNVRVERGRRKSKD